MCAESPPCATAQTWRNSTHTVKGASGDGRSATGTRISGTTLCKELRPWAASFLPYPRHPGPSAVTGRALDMNLHQPRVFLLEVARLMLVSSAYEHQEQEQSVRSAARGAVPPCKDREDCATVCRGRPGYRWGWPPPWREPRSPPRRPPGPPPRPGPYSTPLTAASAGRARPTPRAPAAAPRAVRMPRPTRTTRSATVST